MTRFLNLVSCIIDLVNNEVSGGVIAKMWVLMSGFPQRIVVQSFCSTSTASAGWKKKLQ